jgi:hypothetical protein
MARRPLLYATVFLLLYTARPAHAYLDPAAGSMILQILLGGIAGLAVFLKLFWRKIVAFFGRTGGKPAAGPDTPDGA